MRGIILILNRITFFICALLIFYWGAITHANAQDKHGLSSVSVEMLSEYTTKLYGTDDILVNGRTYIPEHYNAKGNPYFLSDKWSKSTLVIDGKKYDNQEILYNIDIERIILKTIVNNSDKIMLILNNEFVDSFYFGQHYFVDWVKYGPGSNLTGFVEQVYGGSFKVFTRHQKSFVNNYTKNTPNGFYSSTKSINYILSDGQFTKLPTKRSFIKYFSVYKKEINNFMRKNKINYKQAGDNQLKILFEYCDNIKSN